MRTVRQSGIVLVLLYNLAFCAILLLRPVGHNTLVAVDDIAQFLGPLLVLPWCIWPRTDHAGTGHAGDAPSGRRHWAPRLLALSVACFVLGQGLWTLYETVWHHPPFPSWADVAFLSEDVCLSAGLLLLPVRPLPPAARLRVALDSLMIMTGLATTSWYFVLGPTVLQGSGSLLAKVVGTAYPLWDLVLLCCLVLLAARGADTISRPVVRLLALALCIIVVTNSIFDEQQLHGTYATGTLLDVGWPLGYMLLALGAARARHHLRQAALPEHALAPGAPSLGRAMLPYLAIPTVGALLGYTWLTPGDEAMQPEVVTGAVVLLGLLLLRQFVAIREWVALYANNDTLAAANTQLEVLATTDTLTGLANRVLLLERLNADLDTVRHAADPLALLLLDLDRFKEVNDTLGHHMGDALLIAVARRLTDVVGQDSMVGRLGGDEFAVIRPGAGETDATQVAQAICAAIEEPFVVEGQTLSVGVSVGMALAPTHGADATALLRCADLAMYTAKHAGLGYAVFDPAADSADASRLTLAGELRQAIVRGALVLYYQPKVDLASGKVSGVEALVRWPHPLHGLIPPDRFIALAEQTGLIVPLTAWVLDEALRQCAAWAADGHDLAVAVNLSLRNLRDPHLCATVAAALARHGVPPRRLCLELTESVVMADVEGTQATLTHLADLGVHLAIDDFGTGYSSLAYLSQLPVDELKIDRSFVRQLATTAQDQMIVASTIGLGRSLGLSVVTEGVEDAQALELLRQLGADAAQGYYLAHPLPAAEVTAWLRGVEDGQRATA